MRIQSTLTDGLLSLRYPYFCLQNGLFLSGFLNKSIVHFLPHLVVSHSITMLTQYHMTNYKIMYYAISSITYRLQTK